MFSGVNTSLLYSRLLSYNIRICAVASLVPSSFFGRKDVREKVPEEEDGHSW